MRSDSRQAGAPPTSSVIEEIEFELRQYYFGGGDVCASAERILAMALSSVGHETRDTPAHI